MQDVQARVYETFGIEKPPAFAEAQWWHLDSFGWVGTDRASEPPVG